MLKYTWMALALALCCVCTSAAFAQQPCGGAFSGEIDRYRCLLRARLAAANTTSRNAVDAVLDGRYGRRVAPLILDLTGFSSKTRGRGSAHAMMGVLEVWDVLHPVAASHGGVVLKDEADTFYAIFDDVPKALTAALAMQDAIGTLNRTIAAARGNTAMRYCSSIGISYGDIHIIGTKEAFGEQVNAAYDAGEVRAGANELLLTTTAKNAIAGMTVTGVSGTTERNLAGYSLWIVNRTTATSCTSVN